MAKRDRQFFTLLRLIKGKRDSLVAAKAGISSSTVGNWKRIPGKDKKAVMYPKQHTMSKVLEAFDCSMEIVGPDGQIIDPIKTYEKPTSKRGHLKVYSAPLKVYSGGRR